MAAGDIGGVNERYSLDLSTLQANLQAAETRALAAERRVAQLEARTGSVEKRIGALAEKGFVAKGFSKFSAKLKGYGRGMAKAGAGLLVTEVAGEFLPEAWAEPLGDVASGAAYGAMIGGGPGAAIGAVVGVVKAVTHAVRKHDEKLKQLQEKLRTLDERARELAEQVREERRKRREEAELVAKRAIASQLREDEERFYQGWLNRPKG